MDLRADLEAPVILDPLERILVPTGLSIALPAGFEAQVRPRSGLAAKHGITVLNTPGTIDADYRGEIKVILVNLSNTPFEIVPGVIEAYTAITGNGHAFPFGIYDGNKPVGFLMIGFDVDDYWTDAPEIAKGNYNLWRLMIDKDYQIGRAHV